MIKNKNILICGASGFIGQNLVRYFNNHNRIYGTYLTKKPKNKLNNVIWIKANLLQKTTISNLFKKNKYDIIIQCAAVTAGVKSMNSDPFRFISDNAIMNSLLVKASVENNANHFIFLSCTVMYHNSVKSLSEDDFNFKKKIHKSYEGIAYTKLYIENICRFYSNNSKTKFTALRHSNIYGPFDKFNNSSGHFMSSIISKIHNSNNQLLEIWGDGYEKRDFLFIDDLVDGVDIVLKKQISNFEIFNLTYGKSYSIRNIIKKILKISSVKKELIFLKDKPTIKINILVNSKKISKQLNWKRKIKIDDGIKKSINWYKKEYIIK